MREGEAERTPFFLWRRVKCRDRRLDSYDSMGVMLVAGLSASIVCRATCTHQKPTSQKRIERGACSLILSPTLFSSLFPETYSESDCSCQRDCRCWWQGYRIRRRYYRSRLPSRSYQEDDRHLRRIEPFMSRCWFHC